MKENIRELTHKLKTLKENPEFIALFKEVDSLLFRSPVNLELLHLRAELNIKLQKPAKAINDYHTILSIAPDDKTAVFQVDHLKTILKFNNTDIYANPNTNLDPWLD